MLSVMRNTAQPFRVPDPDQAYASQTLWQTVTDLSGLRFIFQSTTRPNLIRVDIAELDLSEGAPTLQLDLVHDAALGGGYLGNVSADFIDRDPLQILVPGAD